MSEHTDRPAGPHLPGDQAGGSAFSGDVRVGVEAWLANAGVAVPPPEDVQAAGPGSDPEAVARKILLDTLTGQPRTRRELADKLARRSVPADVAQRLLNRFAEVGLVDDAEFARAWVRSRHSGRGLARRALAQELRRKGIDDETAKAALGELDPEDEAAVARALVRRKLRTVSGLPAETATRRLAGMLARKGYPAGVAFRVVREELESAGSDVEGLVEPPD